MPVRIDTAIVRATSGARAEHRSIVETAAHALLIPLGAKGLHDRVRLRVTGERPEAAELELHVDETPVWRGAMERGRWVSRWLVHPLLVV